MREPGLLRQPRSFLYFLPLFTNFAVKLPEKCPQQRFSSVNLAGIRTQMDEKLVLGRF
jgi:hypothetical protein